MKTIKLNDHIYGGQITVAIGTWGEFSKAYGGLFTKNGVKFADFPDDDPQVKMMGGYHTMMFMFPKGQDATAASWVWVNSDMEPDTQRACLAHELLHAGLSLFDLLDIKIASPDSQEVLTYWHTWAFRSALKLIK